MFASSPFPPKAIHLTKSQCQSKSPRPLSFGVKSPLQYLSIKATVSVDSVKLRKSPPPATLYQVLFINENASQTEIKAAYRSLAKLHHPDAASELNVNGQDFILIHNAYAVLSDPVARARYNLSIGVATQQCRRYKWVTGTTTLSTTRPTKRWETDQCW